MSCPCRTSLPKSKCNVHTTHCHAVQLDYPLCFQAPSTVSQILKPRSPTEPKRYPARSNFLASPRGPTCAWPLSNASHLMPSQVALGATIYLVSLGGPTCALYPINVIQCSCRPHLGLFSRQKWAGPLLSMQSCRQGMIESPTLLKISSSLGIAQHLNYGPRPIKSISWSSGIARNKPSGSRPFRFRQPPKHRS